MILPSEHTKCEDERVRKKDIDVYVGELMNPKGFPLIGLPTAQSACDSRVITIPAIITPCAWSLTRTIAVTIASTVRSTRRTRRSPQRWPSQTPWPIRAR